jgi:CubicO group peptidase (beta-lactamase class C family)
MSSGKKLRSLRDNPHIEKWRTDWLSWFFESPQAEKAGSKFYYSSHANYTIGRIIEKITNKTVNDYLKQKLWNILDVETPEWDVCPQGHTICAGKIWLSNSDLLKIGQLLLNKGEFGNKKVLKTSYVQQMTNDIIVSKDLSSFEDAECACGYGYCLWKSSRDNTFRIWGAGGNFCVIDFNRELCVTVTAKTNMDIWRNYNDNDVVRGIYQIIDTFST